MSFDEIRWEVEALITLGPISYDLCFIYIPLFALIILISIFVGYILGYKLYEMLEMVKLHKISETVEREGVMAAIVIVFLPIFILFAPIINLMVVTFLTIIGLSYLLFCGIKKIHYVDTQVSKVYIPLLFLPIYAKETKTIVYGE